MTLTREPDRGSASLGRFSILQPDAPRGEDTLFRIPRASGQSLGLLQLPNAPVDFYNADLRSLSPAAKRGLRSLCEIPRMSTAALGAMINRAVAAMAPGHAFVNVGVWNGFTLLAGMTGNPGKSCIGIDDFSQFTDPRDAFHARFEQLRSGDHRFHESDYRAYFRDVHDEPIGVYVYDGDHSYDNQLLGLREAEPYFAAGCIVVVDDTNWSEPREATLDFVAASRNEYAVLVDEPTAGKAHPTYWNGVMMLQMIRRNAEKGALAGAGRTRPSGPNGPAEIPDRAPSAPPASPDVTLVIRNDQPDVALLERALDAALDQMLSPAEVLLVDSCPNDETSELLAGYGSRVTLVDEAIDGREVRLATAVAASSGELVAFLDSGIQLRSTAVEMGLGYPQQSQFFRPLPPERYEKREEILRACRRIASLIPGESYVLVHDRKRLPLPMTPPGPIPLGIGDRGLGEEDAIREIELLRGRGAGWIVFLAGASSWLDRYRELGRHLRTDYRIVVEDSELVVFDLGTQSVAR